MPERERLSETEEEEEERVRDAEDWFFRFFLSLVIFRHADRATESEARQSLSSLPLSPSASLRLTSWARNSARCANPTSGSVSGVYSSSSVALRWNEEDEEGDSIVFSPKAIKKTSSIISFSSFKTHASRFHNQSIDSKRAHRASRVWSIAGESKALITEKQKKIETNSSHRLLPKNSHLLEKKTL